MLVCFEGILEVVTGPQHLSKVSEVSKTHRVNPVTSSTPSIFLLNMLSELCCDVIFCCQISPWVFSKKQKNMRKTETHLQIHPTPSPWKCPPGPTGPGRLAPPISFRSELVRVESNLQHSPFGPSPPSSSKKKQWKALCFQMKKVPHLQWSKKCWMCFHG